MEKKDLKKTDQVLKEMDSFQEAPEPTEKNTSYTYKTSNSVIDNIIRKKDLSLFPSVDDEDSDVEISYKNNGKPVFLTPLHLKIELAFEVLIDKKLNDPEIKEYIESLDKNERKRVEHNGVTFARALKIRTTIDEITKIAYKGSRYKSGHNKEIISDGLDEMRSIIQHFTYKDASGTFVIEAPLISMKRFKYMDANGVKQIDGVELTFEDTYIYKIDREFSLAPITLIEEWNRADIKTEIGVMLLFLLRRKYGGVIKKAKKGVSEKRKELKEANTPQDQAENIISALRTKLLTYSESYASLLDRISSRGYLVNGKYINAKKLQRDIQAAANVFMEMNLITAFNEGTNANGDVQAEFTLNPKWLQKRNLIDNETDSSDKKERKKKIQNTSKDQRKNIVKLFLESGMTKTAFAEAHGISRASLTNWLKQDM